MINATSGTGSLEALNQVGETNLNGNDAEAKAQVINLFSTWFGWRHIVDLGDITNVL